MLDLCNIVSGRKRSRSTCATWGREDTHLEDLLDGVDGGGEQRFHLLVVVDVVGVTDAHEENIRWQTGDGG